MQVQSFYCLFFLFRRLLCLYGAEIVAAVYFFFHFLNNLIITTNGMLWHENVNRKFSSVMIKP
jgi:hypothetical protein